MIDATGTLKIIDFGAARVAGIAEMAPMQQCDEILGTAQYTAPEYFLGTDGSASSDVFSLAVIAYQMLSGQLPYGLEVVQARSRAAQGRLVYRPLAGDAAAVPAWVDGALRKALQPEPARRYQEPSEFVYDLRHPNPEFMHRRRTPLIERNPVAFWKGLALVLGVALLLLLLAFGVRLR
jgi:serine/threonine protein kinase